METTSRFLGAFERLPGKDQRNIVRLAELLSKADPEQRQIFHEAVTAMKNDPTLEIFRRQVIPHLDCH